MERDLIQGLYRHYKDKWYFVLGESTNSETREVYVTYFPLYLDELKLFVRDKAMFLDLLEEAASHLQAERFLESDRTGITRELQSELLAIAGKLLKSIHLSLDPGTE
jgi:hypothetical protein